MVNLTDAGYWVGVVDFFFNHGYVLSQKARTFFNDMAR